MTGEPQPDRIITYEHALRIYNYFQKIGSLREASYFWGEFKNCNLHGSTTSAEKVLDELEKWLYKEGMKFEKICDSEENFVNATGACARRAQCYYTIEKLKELRQERE